MTFMRHQRGQGTVEFLVVMAIFLMLLGGIFEMTRVFRAKLTLNEAAFQVAREGALNNARIDPMVDRLGESMTDLFMTEGSAGSLAAAYAKSTLFTEMLQVAGGGVKIISPTRNVFDQLSKEQFIPLGNNQQPERVRVIPNDNLRWRPNEVADIDNDVTVNIKDANLLKVRTVWCQRLVVPGLDILIYQVVRAMASSASQNTCRLITKGSQLTGVAKGRYIAVTSDATIRMQTPVMGDDLP